MASKCKGQTVPFGYNPQTDRFVWLSSIPLDKYGERCGLVCPSCGRKLQAVRTATNTPHPYFKCFRHSSGSSCSGGFESQLHKAVKSLLADAVGREFRLPMVSLADAAPHASRISDSGRWASGWRGYFEQDSRCRYPEIWVPYTARKCSIEAVELETTQENGLRPDAILTLKHSRGDFSRVAVEIRVKHQKTLEDVAKFSEIGLDVIEIYLDGIDLTSEDFDSMIQVAVFGDLSPRCRRDKRREWLWTSRAQAALYNYYPYVDSGRVRDLKKERAQCPYIGRHAHIAVAKRTGKQAWTWIEMGRLTWNDLTRLCDIIDEIDRKAEEADSVAEESATDSYEGHESDSELAEISDERDALPAQSNDAQDSITDRSDGKIHKKKWWQCKLLIRFLSRFK